MRNLGLFSLWLAREFGGPELSLSEFARGIGALAQADGFVGWGVSVGAAYSRFSGYLPESVARKIFVEERAGVAGALPPSGRAVAVSGGYREPGAGLMAAVSCTVSGRLAAAPSLTATYLVVDQMGRLT